METLDLAYASALKFDCRPGVKFLVQKVMSLEQPANLYKQAAYAWIIKLVTLLEICLREIGKTGANSHTIKTVLSEEFDAKFQYLSKYSKELRSTFDDMCEAYVDVAIDKDGKHSRADSFSERKIFLLIAQPDYYTEIADKEPTGRIINNSGKDDSRGNGSSPNESCNAAEDESGLEEMDIVINPDYERSFRLSDLAMEYSTDSGPESEPEYSRPSSRIGSANDRIVYNYNRSGAASSEGNNIAETRMPHASLSLHSLDSKSTVGGVNKAKSLLSLSELKEKIRLRRSSEPSSVQNYLQVGDKTMTNFEVEKSNEESTKISKVEEKSDHVNELLKDYERSKRGLRLNPFLRENVVWTRAKNRIPDFVFCTKSRVDKDSEAHRKAWADVLTASLQWTLALTVRLMSCYYYLLRIVMQWQCVFINFFMRL